MTPFTNQPEPNVVVTRSFSYKHGLPSYSAVDGFFSLQMTVPLSAAEEAAAGMYELCRRQVLSEIIEYARAVGAPPPPVPAELLLEPLAAPMPAAPAPAPVEENPFKVSARAPEPARQGGAAPAAAPEPPATPPVESPKRRGRPPKKDTGESYAPTADPAAEPLLTEPRVVDAPPFQATDDDLPDNIAAPPKLSQLDRVSAVIDRLVPSAARDSAEWSAIKGKVQEWLREFLQMKPLPKGIQKTLADPIEPVYERALPVLEAFAEQYAGQLRSEPAKSGLEAGDGYNKLIRAIDKWPDPVKALALAAATKQYPDSMDDLIGFVELEPKLQGDANLMIFLGLLAHRTKELAAKVRQTAAAKGVGIYDLLKGLNLIQCSDGEILGRLA